jgi:hypothetical protein
MPTSSFGDYLADLGALLKQEALEARTQASAEANQPDHQFALGRLTAYYEVLSLMRQQAEAFGIEATALSLDGFDPDRELLADRSRGRS